MDWLAQFAPYLVSGLVSAIASWAMMRMELRFLRRDLERLRYNVEASENSRSHVNLLQGHELRIALVEALLERRHEKLR